MRISDWSSDVCSSDLQAARTLYRSLFPSFPSFPAPLAEAAPAGTVAGPIGADPTPVALVQDALRAAVVVAPVGAVEAVQAHRSAAARGMDEAALADIDADVAHVAAAAEEHQVRRGQALGGDARPLVGGEGSRGARQLEVEHVAVDVVDQAAAVEAALGRVAAVAVG